MHTFYHISYVKPYNLFPDFEIGQGVLIGNDFNPFFDHFYNLNEHVEVGIPNGIQNVHYSTWIADFTKQNSVKSYPDPTIFFPYINAKLKDLFTLNRELMLENIRLQYYPDMPSRLKSLWVSNTPEETSVWMMQFITSENLQLITFESSTEPSKALDSKLLPLPHDSLKTKEEKAHAYWSGEVSKEPMIEHLFQGEAIVKDINKINFDG